MVLYAIGLVWLNAYICRDLFFTEYTGHMNSMQGFWTAMARLATSHWFEPGWWPYWDAGMPFEFTYAPLVPGLTALWSKLAGVSPARALQAVTGFFYCLVPLTLFAMCASITRSPGWSFIAAVAYSLLAPTQLVIPDEAFSFRRVGDARRLYLMAVWDETPHVAALAMLPLVLLFVERAVRLQRTRYWGAAGVFMALAVLANAFGATMLILALFCLLFTLGREHWLRNTAAVALTGFVAYVIISPTVPPSLISTIRYNAHVHGDSGWGVGTFTSLSVVILGSTILAYVLNRFRADWWIRFTVQLAWVMSMIPLLYYKFERHFIPQPGRYKVEGELALAIAGVFLGKLLVERLPKPIQVALAFVALSFAAEQVVSHRKYAKTIIRSVDVQPTIEYRTAKWADGNLPQGRVAYPGSMAIWFNAFTDAHQYAGSSYSTAYNPVQQQAYQRWVYAESPEDVRAALLWMKAFGVSAYAIPGKASPEFWKAVGHPEVFGSCEVLWEQDDTRICRLPGARPTYADVLAPADLVRRRPKDGHDTGEVARYGAALDRATPATFRWEGTGAASIHASVPAGQVVAARVSYHPGWKASANGKPAAITSDGLGLQIIQPDCNGPCDIRLVYDGGWELRLCRWASALTILGLLAGSVIRRRRQSPYSWQRRV